MTAFVMKHFDSLEFVKKSKELGANEELAEYQARQIEQAIDIAISTARVEIDTRELATKKDIKELELKIKEIDSKLELKIEQVRAEVYQGRAEMHKSKYEIIIWVAGLLLASGVIQHFFK